MKKNNSLYIIGFLLIVALLASLALVMKNQETRRGATFAGADMYILNHEQRLDLAVGQQFEVDLFVESRNEAKVSQVRSVLCYGPEIDLRATDAIEGNTLAGFSAEPLVRMMVKDGEKCVNFTITSSQGAEDLQFGAVRVAKLRFAALTEGEGRFEVWKEKSKVVGVNPGSNDKEIEIGQVYGRDYVVGGGDIPEPTDVPDDENEGLVLSFKTAFSGLRETEAVCGQDWPVTVVVMGGGETAVFEEVPMTNTGEKTDKGEVVFATGFWLGADWTRRDNLAVFLKGPMHLQIKYGKDGQETNYDKAGGEIEITADTDTSPLYDFSAYPILAGDVTGSEDGVPDGKIDGRDFSYVKSRISVSRTGLSTGERVNGDFDGNCWVGNIDLAILMLSLSEKRDQLY
ncbi:hypothetical protein KJ909_02480 [Patescibacteria group bacterium]|nr:hypothetical protein [Patescibacteria group bacterium]